VDSDGTPILLINPNRMKPPIAPIGLDYVGSALEVAGFDVELLDLCFDTNWPSGLEEYLDRRNPVAIGITVRNTDDCYYLSQDFILPRIKEILDDIRTRTVCPLVLGGVGFSVMPFQTLSYLEGTFGIQGDGEWAFPALAVELRDSGDPLRVPGIVWRRGTELRSTLPRFDALTTLPGPNRDFVDNKRYFLEGGMGGIETKRGCPQSCIYCADPLAKGSFCRVRPPQVVADEIEMLVAKGIDHLHFCDSEFNLPYDHAVAVCNEIISRRLATKLRWYAYLSPVPFSDELARAMVAAGCAGIDFGADHGDDGILSHLGRPHRAEDLTHTAALCRRYKIPFMYDLLLGSPGETRKTLRTSIELMKEVQPSRVGLSIGVRVYPGTRLAAMVMAEGIHADNPNLHGTVSEDCVAPLFYVSAAMGDEFRSFIGSLVAGDERFLLGGGDDTDTNYNYNDNTVLMNAIREGFRGAYWNILRKLSEGEGPP
jgi:radical SAM superfamily enzyme YgiQ (UPF0313 family)